MIKGIALFLKVWYNTNKENGLVFGPGSTCGGDVPRHFLLRGVRMMDELSIFVDESGDFGSYEPHAPFYLFTLVFHDQSNSIENQISHLEHGLADIGFDVKHRR